MAGKVSLGDGTVVVGRLLWTAKESPASGVVLNLGALHGGRPSIPRPVGQSLTVVDYFRLEDRT